MSKEKPKKEKIATRPGSQWAHGKRKEQKGLREPKGYARGARVR